MQSYKLADIQNAELAISYSADRDTPKESKMDTLAERIKAMRDQRGLTQRELAELLGMDQTQYLRYEKGTDPDTVILREIARHLLCTVDYLLGLTDQPAVNKEYDNLPRDEQSLVSIYRDYKRGKHISRAQIRLLRDLNMIEDDSKSLIEAPKESGVSGEEEASNRKVM